MWSRCVWVRSQVGVPIKSPRLSAEVEADFQLGDAPVRLHGGAGSSPRRSSPRAGRTGWERLSSMDNPASEDCGGEALALLLIME